MRLFGLLTCCCGGSTCGWTESWTDEDEVEANWTQVEGGYGPGVLVDGTVTDATLEHPTDGAHQFTMVLSGDLFDSSTYSAVYVAAADFSGYLFVYLQSNGAGTPFWTVDSSDGLNPISPSNPDQPQEVSIWWNDAGEWKATVGDAVVTGTDLINASIMGVSATGGGAVATITATCVPYAVEGFWETSEGAPWETQDNQSWEMQQ
jgi:hypothetical protein